MGRYELIEKKKSSWLVPLILIFLVAVIAAIFIFLLPQDIEPSVSEQGDQFIEILEIPSETSLPEPEQDKSPVESGSVQPPADKSELATQITLPPLEQSDAAFRKDLIALAPGLTPWLGADNLISKLMVICNDFSQGLRIFKHMRYFKLKEPFIAAEGSEGLYMSRKSYQRYDQLATAIGDMDTEKSLALYNKYTPLFNQVFARFSYPDSYQLDDIFKNAAAEILAAPVITGQIELIRPTVRYKFADPELEALSPVQKQMLRMGPENTRKIQSKLRQFLQTLARDV